MAFRMTGRVLGAVARERNDVQPALRKVWKAHEPVDGLVRREDDARPENTFTNPSRTSRASGLFATRLQNDELAGRGVHVDTSFHCYFVVASRTPLLSRAEEHNLRVGRPLCLKAFCRQTPMTHDP